MLNLLSLSVPSELKGTILHALIPFVKDTETVLKLVQILE